jgi:hypothetical protein
LKYKHKYLELLYGGAPKIPLKPVGMILKNDPDNKAIQSRQEKAEAGQNVRNETNREQAKLKQK